MNVEPQTPGPTVKLYPDFLLLTGLTPLTPTLFKGQLCSDREQTSGCQGLGVEERCDYKGIAHESFLE